MIKILTKQAEAYLDQLCVQMGSRQVGRPGNRAATDLFASRARDLGWSVSCPEFDCIDWVGGAVRLEAAGRHFAASPSPYSLGCDVRAPLVMATTLQELEQSDCGGRILLLQASIAAEPLMPKSFSFYNPEERQHIVATLEKKAPVALITATGRNPQRAGAKSPFPMIEDGDFDIPSVFTCEAEGRRLAEAVGHETILQSDARRIPATGCNAVAGRGGPDVPRVVFCAHIDVNTDTSPGAIDNGGGIIVLLLLLDLLKDHGGSPTAEILALNGHEYFAAPGAKLYLQENLPHFSQIALAVNMDGIGYLKGGTGYSLYGCQHGLEQRLRRFFAEQEGFSAGEPWPQSDHMIFVMNGRPAVALTSEHLLEIESTITHTPNDTPDLVDCRHLARVALSLCGLMDELGGHKAP